MAAANQRKAEFIAYKLSFLKDQKAHLISSVDEYVDKIFTAGRSWTEGGGNQIDFTELCHMIDRAVEFICVKCEEMSGDTGDVIVNQLCQSSVEQSDLTSVTQPPSASISAPTTTSDRQTAAAAQAPDKTVLSQVLARIGVIEEAICSVRSNAERVAEKQSDLDKQLSEVSTKLSKSDKKQNIRLNKVKEQVVNIAEDQTTMKEEQETRLTSLEEQLEMVSAKQNQLVEQMGSHTKEIEEELAYVAREAEFGKARVDEINCVIDRIRNEHTRKMDSLENVTVDLSEKVKANTKTLETLSGGQEENMDSLRGFEAKLLVIEADGGSVVRKRIEEAETNLKILCQMLNNRLKPMEQLRKCLNDHASARDGNIKKLCQVVKEVEAMSPRLKQLDKTVLSQVLARIGEIEEAICSVRSNAERVAEKQSDLDKQLSEVSTKLSKSDKKQNIRLNKVKEQVVNIAEDQTTMKEEQETRLTSLEEQLEMVSAKQNQLVEQMGSHTKEIEEELAYVAREAEFGKARVDEINCVIDRIRNEHTRKMDSLENVTVDLSEKVKANTKTLETLSGGQEENMDSLRGFEAKLLVIEADGGSVVRKRIEEAETNFKILCQMLNNRLKPMEQLRKCLNGHASARDDNIKKLCQVVKEVEAMSPRLKQLEMQSSNPVCGFTAWTGLTNDPAEGSPIAPYDCVLTNAGGHFDLDTGTFTAPRDGLYVGCLSLHLTKSAWTMAYFKHFSAGLDNIKLLSVCSCVVEVQDTTGCQVRVFEMKAGDRLLSCLESTDNGCVKCVTFSCFSLRS